jgi:DNA polymerase-3 subunit gamma/tau
VHYVVLARRYRPQTFDDVTGQEPIAATLKNAIESNRVGHAYLFTGPRGVGKTSMARIFAKALNCVHGPTGTPCGECEICRDIQDGHDIDVLEIDGASNRSIEDVRAIRDNVRYAPSRAKYKIYVIDEVHQLTRDAFNALLKTLEEPPAHVKFIFATTEPHKLPDTVHSRCQRFDFKRISSAAIANRLKRICDAEHVEVEPRALSFIARQAQGGMRDSLSLLDQLISFTRGKIALSDAEQAVGSVGETSIVQLMDALADEDRSKALMLLDSLYERGREPLEFIDAVLQHLRRLLLCRAVGADSPLLEDLGDFVSIVAEQSKRFSEEALLYMIDILVQARMQLRLTNMSRIPLETAVLKMAAVKDLRPIGELLSAMRTGKFPQTVEVERVVKMTTVAPAEHSANVPEPSPREILREPVSTVEPKKKVAVEPPPAPVKPVENIPPAASVKTPVISAAAASPAPAKTAVAELEVAPVPTPIPASEPAASELTLDVVKARWPEVLKDVQESKRAVGAMLVEAVPHSLEGDHLTLAFDSAYVFHREMLEERKNVVEEVLKKVFSRRLRLGLLTLEGAKPSAREAAEERPAAPIDRHQSRRKALEDHGVRLIIEMFGGEVTKTIEHPKENENI